MNPWANEVPIDEISPDEDERVAWTNLHEEVEIFHYYLGSLYY